MTNIKNKIRNIITYIYFTTMITFSNGITWMFVFSGIVSKIFDKLFFIMLFIALFNSIIVGIMLASGIINDWDKKHSQN